MKITYDPEADAAYICIEGFIKKGGVKKTVAFNENIILDFDSKNRLLGVEILDASKVLNKKVLEKADLL